MNVLAELRIDGEAARIEGCSMAQGLNGDDAERENFALLFKQARERPPDVAIAKERQPQKSIRSINEFRSDSSVVRVRRSWDCWSRSAASLVSIPASCRAYCCTSSCWPLTLLRL
jgi:hypothetical protein